METFITEYPLISGGAARFRQSNEGLEIIIPVPKATDPIIFLSVWLCGWAVGEAIVGGILIKSVINLFTGEKVIWPLMIFMSIWLTGWTFGGVQTIRELLWMLIGKEIISVTNRGIKITEKIGGWIRSKFYDVHEILNIRVKKESEEGYRKKGTRQFMLSRALEFEFRKEKVEFASGIKTEEADALMQLLKKCRSLKRENFPMEPMDLTEDCGYHEDKDGKIYFDLKRR